MIWEVKKSALKYIIGDLWFLDTDHFKVNRFKFENGIIPALFNSEIFEFSYATIGSMKVGS